MPFAAAAFLLFIHYWGEAERHWLDERVAALRAAGQPVRYEDLETPRVPDEANAAVVLDEAQRMLKKREESEHPSYYELREETSPEERDRMRAYLGSLKPYFDKLSEVPERPLWYVEHEWKKGPGCGFAELGWLQDASCHLLWRTQLDAQDAGRTRRAADAAVLAISLGERFRMPMMIGHLVGQTATIHYPALLLRTALREPGFDAAEFRRIVDPRIARAFPGSGPSRETLAQERVIVLWALETLRSGGRDVDEYLPLKGLLHRNPAWRPLLYRDASRALDLFEEAIALAEKPAEEARRSAARLGRRCSTEDQDPRYQIASMTAGVLPRYFESYARCAAAQRLTRVAMALLEYRQRQREWPLTLAALGDLPLDPYTGEPFVYERTDAGARVRAAREVPGAEDAAQEWEALEEDGLAWTFAE
jgi:hypothetical protein